VTDLHGTPVRAGKPAQQLVERGDVGGRERLRQLNPESVQPGAERLDHLQEFLELGINAGETTLMGDDLGKFGDEPEVLIRLPGPGLHRASGRGGVKGRVALDRVAPAGIVAKPLVCSGTAGQNAPGPRLMSPHRAADMQAHHPSLIPATVVRIVAGSPGSSKFCVSTPTLRQKG
jgi:hypothetical protein